MRPRQVDKKKSVLPVTIASRGVHQEKGQGRVTKWGQSEHSSGVWESSMGRKKDGAEKWFSRGLATKPDRPGFKPQDPVGKEENQVLSIVL